MRIQLLQQTAAHVKALRTGADAYLRLSGYPLADGVLEMASGPDVSPEFPARQEAAAGADVWLHGFAIVESAEGVVIGLCGYKGPPSQDGVVEIAYGLAPAYRGRGYATEAAQELVARAFSGGLVRRVIAHTLPELNASTRVLARCGFARLGDVIDPEDGLVWRWEKRRERD
ncbi:MAG TPA: GNAT family N-acetyltransferase [Verrucomicrobiae bacterium]|nr:GNAT family N-acetyltransferase [Verrucomicrobiae bacterium]